MDPTLIGRLEALKAATDVVLNELEEQQEEIKDAVNWADLRCVEARAYVNELGHEGLLVVIEEVAPEAYVFHHALATALAARGFADVEVISWW